MSLSIATWNVNSARQRAGHIAAFLDRVRPDLLLLQEIKCEAKAFPAEAFAQAGYGAEIVGQKAYNGVAVLSRVPVRVTERVLPGLDPALAEQARYIEVETRGVRVGNLYLPNGNSGGEAGYAGKLAWMGALADHAQRLLDEDVDLVLAGDYNVCPEDVDFAPRTLPAGDALIRDQTRAAFRRLIWLGLTDALRAVQPGGPAYTFWDYQAGCWPQDRGLRIDHALLSPRLAERLESVRIERDERAAEQPSDHVPVVITLGDQPQ